MRRALAALLALALSLCAAVALAEETAELRSEEYSLVYPAQWRLDVTSYDDETTDTQIWVGDLSEDANEGLYVECWIVRISTYEDFAAAFENADDFSLAEADEEASGRYRQYWLDSAERDGLEPTYLETVSPEAEGEGAPFLLFKMSDGDGAYLYATTVVKGSEYCFFCYRNDYADVTETQMETIRTLLRGFTPLDRAGYNA